MKTKIRRIERNLLPRQYDFVTGADREVLYSGAFGAGKSRAVCEKLLKRASVKGAREGLCRKHLSTLKASTLKTLLEPEGDLPPVLPAGTYTHQKADRIIQIHGGGSIYYFGLDDEQKIGSLNLSGIGVDQAEELAETEWTALRGRCRLKVEDLPNQIYAACNPSGPAHFLAVRFGLDDVHDPAAGCRAIRTRSRDNRFLPADYLADLMTFTGVAKARYVEGRWVAAEGLIYGAWDRQIYVRERQGPWSKVILGMDFGFRAPTAIAVVCKDAEGRIHIADELYRSELLNDAIIEEARKLRAIHGAERIMLDPSAATLREDMRRHNLPAEEANNDVPGGLMVCQKYVCCDGGGIPRMTVAPHCRNFIAEIESYVWATGAKEKPKKESDHLMDAWRYAMMHLDGGVTFDFRIIDTGKTKPAPINAPRDEETEEQKLARFTREINDSRMWNEVELDRW